MRSKRRKVLFFVIFQLFIEPSSRLSHYPTDSGMSLTIRLNIKKILEKCPFKCDSIYKHIRSSTINWNDWQRVKFFFFTESLIHFFVVQYCETESILISFWWEVRKKREKRASVDVKSLLPNHHGDPNKSGFSMKEILHFPLIFMNSFSFLNTKLSRLWLVSDKHTKNVLFSSMNWMWMWVRIF